MSRSTGALHDEYARWVSVSQATAFYSDAAVVSMTADIWAVVKARAPAQPAGFRPLLLSCCWCGNREDQIDLEAAIAHDRVVEWFDRHQDCEAATKLPHGWR